MRAAQERVAQGTYTPPSQATVAEFFQRWFKSLSTTTAPTTATNYENLARAYVLPVIGQRRARDLSPEMISTLYNHLLTQGVLVPAMKAAKVWNYVATNPMPQVTSPSVERRTHTTWSADEMRRFLDAARQDRWYALCDVRMSQAVECSLGPFGAHFCSPFAPRCAPMRRRGVQPAAPNRTGQIGWAEFGPSQVKHGGAMRH
ncbi:tyrosine-type recombinase/integrase [Actinokineospora bangkokensis]|uniref:Integrase SAM-like N-terminal domain-containing protein n=1 Tax=Actinokineospora bangkokensis TaxID=1193682 RepID=A0A1Q9LSV7_9PSEU|nr:hypothetical protein [Actinokineospora bangkokensis]OLR95081.1 hypothetical protein BJP25_09060 [Actinokineospora bangkokensis]